MAPDLGVKYACYQCGTKFYDLHKPVPSCPKCGADQRNSPAKSIAAAERRRARAKGASEEDEDGVPAVVGDDDEAEDVAAESDEAPLEEEPEDFKTH